jgi:tetratricopeptide (TPR) repeat protein
VLAAVFDVFVSYTHADGDWVRRLAENLHEEGLRVYLDEWEVGPGDVIVHSIDEGLMSSHMGVVVVSSTSMKSRWVAEEYAAMIGRAIVGKLRLIPVLYGDAEMPPLLANRMWVDFRGADGPEYERRVRQLAAALRGDRLGPPPRGGGLKPPPGSGLRAEGPLRRTLRIDTDEVILLGGEKNVSHRPRGLDGTAEQRLSQLDRARKGWPEGPTGSATAAGTSIEERLQQALLGVGASLGKSFLAGAAGAALRQAVAQAQSLNEPLELAVDIADERIADLPWETLRVPAPDGEFDPPLVLNSHVRMYRSVPTFAPAPAIQLRGPLRVLVAIGSPETDNERGELLDMEAELALILDMVEAARTTGPAHVRILKHGTAAGIREALEAEGFHVVHITCHALPGRLVLEDEQGGADLVDAEDFAKNLVLAGRGVALVVLSGCSTPLAERERQTEQREGEVALSAVARRLLELGVPAVLAMNAPVSDAYATRLMAQVYHRLATAERPEVLEALSDARWKLENVRSQEPMGSPWRQRAEWATPALFRRGPGLPLYDVRDGLETIGAAAEPALQAGIVVRRVGEFVGRRRERRILRRGLHGEKAGVVIHGLGGVGKSTLAAQLVSDLAEEMALVVSVVGATTVDQVLAEVGLRLFVYCMDRHLPEDHAYRELSQVVRNPQLEWRERLGYLGQLLLGRERVLLLLDNFDDNLEEAEGGGGWQVADAELASLLASWVERPGRSRLVVTSRYPFQLPEGQEGRLEAYHLGPLTLAETRQLIWDLPGLNRLNREEQRRAYADVGGHPRALEYLDALLRGGEARFGDMAERMEGALRARGVSRPRAWMRGARGDLDRALAEAVTLAVDDVLLAELLGRLEPVPGARRLLLGTSVYRLPVDEIGLKWQAGEELELPADPARDERRARLDEAQAAAAREGRSPALEELGLDPELVARIREDWREAMRPPLRVPGGFEEALRALAELGLVAPLEGGADEERTYAVHRWTARALAAISEGRELVAAHRRAAGYWLWRVRVWPQSRERDVEQLVEARHHLHAAGDLDAAVDVTDAVVRQLDVWGAYGWEERLCLETLGWLPERSRQAAAYQHQLGIVAQGRGDYAAALDWYRRSLAVKEELGDRAGMSAGFHQLGVVAQQRGDYEAALDWYRRSLAIEEQLGDSASIAASYHQLGLVAQARGDYDVALEWYQRSLAISGELGNRGAMATSYHQLGNVAYQRGEYEAATEWYRRSLAILEDLGNRGAMATSYHQLGNVAYQRGDYEAATEWHRRSLAIKDELGDRAGVASSYHQLGIVAQDRGDYETASEWYRRSLTITEELQDRAGMARSYHQLGIVAQQQGDHASALAWYRRSLAIAEELGDRAGVASSYHQLGMVAQARGDYEEALNLYRQSLSIDEALGNRAGTAVTYHQLGRVAQKQGDYRAALDWYQRALDIAEALDDQAGIASTASQLGVLLTETGRASAAITYNLTALSTRLRMHSPESAIDVHWLARQRLLLGEDEFQKLVRTRLDEASATNLMQLLSQEKG